MPRKRQFQHCGTFSFEVNVISSCQIFTFHLYLTEGEAFAPGLLVSKHRSKALPSGDWHAWLFEIYRWCCYYDWEMSTYCNNSWLCCACYLFCVRYFECSCFTIYVSCSKVRICRGDFVQSPHTWSNADTTPKSIFYFVHWWLLQPALWPSLSFRLCCCHWSQELSLTPSLLMPKSCMFLSGLVLLSTTSLLLSAQILARLLVQLMILQINLATERFFLTSCEKPIKHHQVIKDLLGVIWILKVLWRAY